MIYSIIEIVLVAFVVVFCVIWVVRRLHHPGQGCNCGGCDVDCPVRRLPRKKKSEH